MSIIPYNNYTVTDLSGLQQPYVNSTVEFGYFGSIASNINYNNNWYSFPVFLNTNNGIASVSNSYGLNILQAGIYKITLAMDFKTSGVISTNNVSVTFCFGNVYLNNVSLSGSFGQSHTSGMISYGSNATSYPGIIDWITNSFSVGPTLANNYVIANNLLMYVYYTQTDGNGTFSQGICTTEITFIINEPTIIYLSAKTPSTLVMGKSYFTLQLINNIPPPNWTTINWTKTNSLAQPWYGIASSSSGQYLAAVSFSPGVVYTSSNYGASWTSTNASNLQWYRISSDSTGQYLAAGIYNGSIYHSSNYGTSWTISNAPTKIWNGIASDSTGQYLAAVGNSGSIYTSSNYGANWIPQASPLGAIYLSIASDNTGKYLVAGGNNNLIATSSDYGVSWSPNSGPGSHDWQAVASSSSGQYLVAVYGTVSTSVGGYIYVSSNYGVSWTQTIAPNLVWISVTSDSTGKYLAAGANSGQMYLSSNYGISWTQTNASNIHPWYSMTSSSSGQYINAGTGDNNGIYRGVYSL
jgi:hypothetical protein